MDPDLANDPLVAVTLGPIDPNLFVEYQTGQVLLGSLSEGLGFLGRVNTLEADLVLLAVGIEDGYRVPISNADYTTGQGVGVCGADQ